MKPFVSNSNCSLLKRQTEDCFLFAASNTDEEKALLDWAKCPNAPVLKPRNQWFKYNSAKNFVLMENLTEYTPFFYSEGEESSDGDNNESTKDFQNNWDDWYISNN